SRAAPVEERAARFGREDIERPAAGANRVGRLRCNARLEVEERQVSPDPSVAKAAREPQRERPVARAELDDPTRAGGRGSREPALEPSDRGHDPVDAPEIRA